MKWNMTVLLGLWLSGCDSNAPSARPAADGSGAGPAAASSDVPTHTEQCRSKPASLATIDARWIIKPTYDQPSPVRSISTTDIAIATDATFFILDSHNDKVLHVDATGDSLGAWGRRGDGPGEFRGSSAIAIGPDGRVYVANGRGRVNVFFTDGKVSTSYNVTGITAISDLLVLPNHNLVIAADPIMGEGATPYVVIVDSAGALVREVLNTGRRVAGSERPLIGHRRNLVRLSAGQNGDFAVWYPAENYVELFDSAGVARHRIVGCLPERVQASYERQQRRETDRQALFIVTLGVGLALSDSAHIQVASVEEIGSTGVLHVRTLIGDRYVARAFDLASALPMRFPVHGLVFLSEDRLLAYHPGSSDMGLSEVVLRRNLREQERD